MIDDLVSSVLRDAAADERRSMRPQNVQRVWRGIEADLREPGPFAAMLRSFREAASEALTDLIFADAADPTAVRSRQEEVKRYLHTMEIVRGFKDRAAATDAVDENEIEPLDTDTDFIPDLED